MANATKPVWDGVSELPPEIIQDILEDSHKLLFHPAIGHGLMKIHSDAMVMNGRLKTMSEGLNWFTPRYEQRLIMLIRRECKRRGRPCSIIVAKARSVGTSGIAAHLNVAEMAVGGMWSMNCLTLNKDVLGDPVRLMLRNALQSLPKPFNVTITRGEAGSGYDIEFYRDEKTVELPRGQLVIPAVQGKINLITAEKGAGAGVGSRAGRHWVSEYAKLKGAEEVMRTFDETLMGGPNSFRFVESTCEGTGNPHHDEFENAWRLQGGVNPFHKDFNWDSDAGVIAVMFPYFYADDRAMPLKDGVTPADVLAKLDPYEMEQLNSPIGIYEFLRRADTRARLQLPTPADVDRRAAEIFHYMRCYSKLIPEMKHYQDVNSRFYFPITPAMLSKGGPRSWANRKKEMPWDVNEAFTNDFAKVFSDATIQGHSEETRAPVAGFLDENGRFSENDDGWLSLWLGDQTSKNPEENSAETRRVLAANDNFYPRIIPWFSSDFANGDNPNSLTTNYSGATGWTIKEEQTCEIELKEKPEQFKAKLLLLGKFMSGNKDYRIPYEIPEHTGAGMTYAQWLEANHKMIMRVYYHTRADRAGLANVEDPHRIGFWSNIGNTDSMAWAHFETCINEPGRVKIRSKRLLDQIKALSRNPKTGRLQATNKGKAMKDNQDDLADTLKMFLWHKKQVEEFSGGKIEDDFGYDCDAEGNIIYRDVDEMDRTSEEFRKAKREEELGRSRTWTGGRTLSAIESR